MAQEKTKDEKDKELKILEEIDQQKKALVEQKKTQDEMQKALELSHKELDSAMLEVKTKVPYCPVVIQGQAGPFPIREGQDLIRLISYIFIQILTNI